MCDKDVEMLTANTLCVLMCIASGGGNSRPAVSEWFVLHTAGTRKETECCAPNWSKHSSD
jgi:hypothetical protein